VTIADRITALEQRVAALETRPAQSRAWRQRNVMLVAASAQLWQYLFDEPMPVDLIVKWVPYLHGNKAAQAHIGGFYDGGEIHLDWSYVPTLANPLAVLIHEIAHSRGFQHGREMTRRVKAWCAKICVPYDG
jgi:hypothetical protein